MKERLSRWPVLARFVALLIDRMYPELAQADSGVSGYFIDQAIASYSSSDWRARELSCTAVIRLSGSGTAAPVFRTGCLANTNHGMFAVTVRPDGFISEIEMYFYTKQAPPFLDEILGWEESRVRIEVKNELLRDASNAGFFDIDEFFLSLADRPMKVVSMEE